MLQPSGPWRRPGAGAGLSADCGVGFALHHQGTTAWPTSLRKDKQSDTGQELPSASLVGVCLMLMVRPFLDWGAHYCPVLGSLSPAVVPFLQQNLPGGSLIGQAGLPSNHPHQSCFSLIPNPALPTPLHHQASSSLKEGKGCPT